ncbi:Transcriptional regulator, LacI family (modular protein) (plasmid) [Cupriavidus neocaledonicus]|uniref:Transcriptional regulator, LacI family (Modular protein) n=2 Tax=Cupriavidus neocaledonicus TaxID=1040979 RepID=A0A375HLR2_9BURK|nr:Transcriptional regulator, LacI family (modular protein) [Cupriavidus neocaledonicus]
MVEDKEPGKCCRCSQPYIETAGAGAGSNLAVLEQRHQATSHRHEGNGGVEHSDRAEVEHGKHSRFTVLTPPGQVPAHRADDPPASAQTLRKNGKLRDSTTALGQRPCRYRGGLEGSFRIRGIDRNVCSSYLTMSKRLTSIDIANLAGVSQTTVSRVLQDLPSVKPETKARVLKVIQDYEYSPSAAARQMKTRRSGTVAVVIASLSNPLYPMLLQLLVDRLASRGFRTTVWELEGKMDEATVRALAESATDGVIFAAALDESREMLTRVAAEKPIILIHRSVGTDLFDTIVSDNYAGGRRVADYFVSAGRKCIGLISAASSKSSKASTIRERERGFMEGLGALSQGNAFVRADAADFSYEYGFRTMQTLLAERPDVDAVFCTNDIVAIGALDAARHSGKQVPGELWVVGYDDIPMARWECISLSTVQQPLPAMVEQVVDRLQRRMTTPDLAPYTFVLPNDLVLRRTTS